MTKPCPGPVAPRKPRLKAPPGACDTHAHILGPYARYPQAEDRSYTAPESTVDDYLNLLDTLGLERGVIVHGSANGKRMDVSIDALKRLGRRGRGVAVVDPSITDAELTSLHDAGFRGLRFTTMLRGGSSVDHVRSMAGRIAPLGWHVQVFVNGPTELVDVIPALGDLPVPVVIDHMGYFQLADGVNHPGFVALQRFIESGAGWTKLSCQYRTSVAGPPYADITPFAKALIGVRTDRLIWASDWPHVMLWDRPMPNDADILDWALTWDVPDQTLEQIFTGNPSRLYQFDA